MTEAGDGGWNVFSPESKMTPSIEKEANYVFVKQNIYR